MSSFVIEEVAATSRGQGDSERDGRSEEAAIAIGKGEAAAEKAKTLGFFRRDETER